MRRIQWFILAGAFFIISAYFTFLYYSMLAGFGGSCINVLGEQTAYIQCITKHNVFGSIYQIAFILMVALIACGLFEKKPVN